MESVTPPRRFAFSPQVVNLRPDPSRLKALTDGDQQAWRRLYQGVRYNVPTAQLVLTGNTAPQALGLTENAILDRARAVPYPALPEAKRELLQFLDVLPQVAWFGKGFVYCRGLVMAR